MPDPPVSTYSGGELQSSKAYCTKVLGNYTDKGSLTGPVQVQRFGTLAMDKMGSDLPSSQTLQHGRESYHNTGCSWKSQTDTNCSRWTSDMCESRRH
jgi:hypothetical protein